MGQRKGTEANKSGLPPIVCSVVLVCHGWCVSAGVPRAGGGGGVRVCVCCMLCIVLAFVCVCVCV